MDLSKFYKEKLSFLNEKIESLHSELLEEREFSEEEQDLIDVFNMLKSKDYAIDYNKNSYLFVVNDKVIYLNINDADSIAKKVKENEDSYLMHVNELMLELVSMEAQHAYLEKMLSFVNGESLCDFK